MKLKKKDKNILIISGLFLLFVGFLATQTGLFSIVDENSSGYSMDGSGETLTKTSTKNMLFYIYNPGYSNYINYNSNDYAWKTAYSYAKISLSGYYGFAGTYQPMVGGYNQQIKCEGTNLYLYKGAWGDDWDDIESHINCNENGCTGYDKKWTCSGGSGSLKWTMLSYSDYINQNVDKPASMFWVCYDYDNNGDYWSWTWTGWGYWNIGEIKTKQCNSGEINCDGKKYQSCEYYRWKDEGYKIGKCGVDCVSGNKCVGKESFICSNYQWNSEGFTIDKCGVECMGSEDKCIGSNYYTCSNYQWNSEGQIMGKCGVECSSNQDCPSETSDNYCKSGGGFTTMAVNGNTQASGVYYDFQEGICSNGICSLSQKESVLVDLCDNIVYSDNYCDGDDLVRDKTSEYCDNSQSICQIGNPVPEIIKTCQFGCLNGACLGEIPPMPEFNWLYLVLGLVILAFIGVVYWSYFYKK